MAWHRHRHRLPTIIAAAAVRLARQREQGGLELRAVHAVEPGEGEILLSVRGTETVDPGTYPGGYSEQPGPGPGRRR